MYRCSSKQYQYAITGGLATAVLLLCAVGVCVIAIACISYRSRKSRKMITEKYVCALFPSVCALSSMYIILYNYLY